MPLSTHQLTVAHRRQQLALRKTTVADLERLWPALDWADLDATYPRFAAEVAKVVGRQRRTSAGLAAAYLRAFRVASGLSGDVRMALPKPLDLKQLDASLHSTTVAQIKISASKGVDQATAMSNAQTVGLGAMVALALNGGRETLARTAEADPEARGVRRVVGGEGCDYCQEREGTPDLSAHGHCGCTAEPNY